MIKSKREVQLHSHDFEWEDLARECRIHDEDEEDANDTEKKYRCQTQELTQEAKDKWDAFHQRNNG